KNVDNYRCSICDPFTPYSLDKLYVEVEDLFKDFDIKFDNNFENKYIINYDKIVGFNNSGALVIKDLIKDTGPNYNDWIFYLRNQLKDFDNLIVKSKQAAKEATFDIDKKLQYSKYLVTWTLKYEKIYDTAIYVTSDRNVKQFVKEYDCLDNDDLVMVTALGVLIWTFNTKVNKIELNCFWG
ncbi:2873_t:CDS:2, partial [Gigaspora rosea]